MSIPLSRVVVVGCVLAVGCVKQIAPERPVAPVVPVAPVAPSGPGLVVTVEPDDAELIIDGVNYGRASKLETTNGMLPLKTGIYQVSLKRQGYVSWRAEVTVNDKPERLQVTLLRQ